MKGWRYSWALSDGRPTCLTALLAIAHTIAVFVSTFFPSESQGRRFRLQHRDLLSDRVTLNGSPVTLQRFQRPIKVTNRLFNELLQAQRCVRPSRSTSSAYVFVSHFVHLALCLQPLWTEAVSQNQIENLSNLGQQGSVPASTILYFTKLHSCQRYACKQNQTLR